MDSLGVNITLLLAQLLNFGLFFSWILLAVVALFRLRRLDLSAEQRLGWAALVVLVPLLGALAVLIVHRRPSAARR
jgi:hypothetical protein